DYHCQSADSSGNYWIF
nr:immunoglobulin light chain junction region [Macaca mulatta]MOW27455.1 immunoglobulin light chain junction region [Macaca mulatta]MOW27599.1 immunoglobulin light chain junction region [Macaca mulatta]MOW27788.1 immunoglobulin light chain junction region [Macaca mulatta]MOW27809.1 immunoglobulin light chain junction region [Macaca mulatta]